MECTQSEELDIKCLVVQHHMTLTLISSQLEDHTQALQKSVTNQLQIVYYNACSLVPKLDHFRVLSGGSVLDNQQYKEFLTATNNWLEKMKSGIESAAVFFDFTRAFDFVPHQRTATISL